MPTDTKRTFAMPTFTGSGFPGFDLSKLDLSKVQLPKFTLPKVELPKIDLPKVDLPGVDVDRLADLARDAAYAGVGLLVLTVEKIAERGRDLQAKVTASARQVADAIV